MSAVDHPDVAVAVGVPCGVFFAVIAVSVVWMALIYIKSKVSQAQKQKEAEAQEAKLKARS
jgi:uncharacterized membrane protein YciS (DUF1049 family)